MIVELTVETLNGESHTVVEHDSVARMGNSPDGRYLVLEYEDGSQDWTPHDRILQIGTTPEEDGGVRVTDAQLSAWIADPEIPARIITMINEQPGLSILGEDDDDEEDEAW
jgi:hypothetical protein